MFQGRRPRANSRWLVPVIDLYIDSPLDETQAVNYKPILERMTFVRRPVDGWATDSSLQEITAFVTRYGRAHGGAGPTASPRLLQRHGLVQFDCRHELYHSSSSRDGSGVPHRTGSSAGPVHRGQEASASYGFSTSQPSFCWARPARYSAHPVSNLLSSAASLPRVRWASLFLFLSTGPARLITSLFCFFLNQLGVRFDRSIIEKLQDIVVLLKHCCIRRCKPSCPSSTTSSTGPNIYSIRAWTL